MMSMQGKRVVRGACPLDCPDTCSWEVTVENGRAIDLHGTRDHPFTRGSLCVKVSKYLDHAAAPDRLLYPMRRVGRKGAGRFERISWDDALGEIASNFSEVIDRYGGEAIWPYFGSGNMGFIQGIEGAGQRLWNVLGASQHVPSICHIAGAVGMTYALGHRDSMDPETFGFSKLILLWGTNTLTTGNHFWRFVSEARREGAYVVVIDPIRTRTADRADEHLAIVPGTDAALALGLLHVVVSMGAEDRKFLEERTLGWPEFQARIQEFPPDRVAEITGLAEHRIVALGERLATTRPTGIRLGQGMQRHAGGGMAARTIATIPGVTGDWQYPGGGVLYSTGAFFKGNSAALCRGDLSPPDTRKLLMTRLGEGLLEIDDPAVKSLVIYGANPAASTPDQSRVRRGLEREDLFTVVIEHFPTDTVDYADIVLPSTMQTEHADLHNAYGHLYLQWNEPAVEPPGECLSNSEIFRRLARRMGLNEPGLYDSDEDMARAVLDSDHPSTRGITLERLKEEGWVRLNYPDPYLAFADGFPTATGRLEFSSARMAEDGFDPLPGYTAPKEISDGKLSEQYPLALITPASHYFLNTIFANKPELQARAGPVRILLHPEDAASRGLEDGAEARVYNHRGQCQVLIEVSDRVRPGVAAGTKGHWSKLIGNVDGFNATVDERDADMGGGAVYHDNRVHIQAV